MPRRPRRPLPPGPPVRHTRKHREIRRLTKQILDREQAGNRADAQARAEVGGMLRDVHAKLDHGEWLAWLDEEVPYSPRTAQRAIALHDWAQEHPAMFRRLSSLGPSKVSLLMDLPLHKLKRMADARKVTVPGTGLRIPLDHLSFKQVLRVVHPAKTILEKRETERAITRVTQGIRRLAKTTAALAVADVPKETAASWHDALLEAAAELAERFELE